jgi:hypothetical protein
MTMTLGYNHTQSDQLGQADFQALLREKMRQAVRLTLITILEEEVEGFVGAERYERMSRRRNQRNGSYCLNAGAPIVTVQTILGHKNIDTTRRYTRLYDGTVAVYYYRAMAEVEGRMGLQDAGDDLIPSPAHLLALVDSLRNGTLNDAWQETVRALRDGILALVRHETVTPSVVDPV